MKYVIAVICVCICVALTSSPCARNAGQHVPILDLSQQTFSGFTGGLYPNGNEIPNAHYTKGMSLSAQIMPRNAAGQTDANGSIGLLILGYSTAAMTGRTFRDMLQYTQVDTTVDVIIGAQGGQDLQAMIKPETTYWDSVQTSIRNRGLTAEQVQMIWMSSGNIADYTLPFPEQSENGIDVYQQVLQRIRIFFPSVQIVFISDRPYAGYIGTGNPPGPKELAEPSGYYHSWTVKWLIEKQINQEEGFRYTDIPFIDWGPTLWTNGTDGDSKGYYWDCLDAGKGGIHPTSKGRMKEAAKLYTYFSQHPYTAHLFTQVNPSSK